MTAHELKNEIVPQTQAQTPGVFAFLASLLPWRKRPPAPPTLEELGLRGEAWVRQIAKDLPADNANKQIAVHIPPAITRLQIGIGGKHNKRCGKSIQTGRFLRHV